MFTLASNSHGQELRQMQASELKLSNVIPLDASKVILVVRSLIKNLQFTPNHGKITVEKRTEGEWWIHLEAETYWITFSAETYQSINVRIYIPIEQRSAEIEIKSIGQAPDKQPPKISHSGISQATEGDTLVLNASVIDNDTVRAVYLFYRFKGEAEYDSLQMTLTESNDYRQTIIVGKDSIEYYITAQDNSGNEDNRMKSTPQLIVVKEKSGKKWPWIVLGSTAIVAGVIAAIVLWDGDEPQKPGTLSKLPDPPPAPR